MKFIYSYGSERKFLAADVQRFVDFLEAHGVETVSQLEISCYPWRNGKRLQAVNAEGKIRPVTFDLPPDDERYQPPQYQVHHEPLTVRERPDELGNFGFATAFDHDD